MKRTILSLLALSLFSVPAFAWGSAGHAWIDARLLPHRNRLLQANAIYGAMAPDLFNYLFDASCQKDLYIATHYGFAALDAGRAGIPGQALAYGFVTHNDAWGADFTAHHGGITFGQAEGYVIAKAEMLLQAAPLPPELPIPADLLLEIYHNIVESAVDILVRRLDPEIGRRIVGAALLRTPRFPDMMAGAYAADFGGCFPDAAAAIGAAETSFREMMALYGEALSQDEATAVQLLSEQMADLAPLLIGGPLPISRDETIRLVAALIGAALELCENDFAAELQATAVQVAGRMEAHGYAIEATGVRGRRPVRH